MSFSVISCEICSKEFKPRQGNQKACSAKCSKIRSSNISERTLLKQDEKIAAFNNKYLLMKTGVTA